MTKFNQPKLSDKPSLSDKGLRSFLEIELFDTKETSCFILIEAVIHTTCAKRKEPLECCANPLQLRPKK